MNPRAPGDHTWARSEARGNVCEGRRGSRGVRAKGVRPDPYPSPQRGFRVKSVSVRCRIKGEGFRVNQAQCGAQGVHAGRAARPVSFGFRVSGLGFRA
jgi:hypothetical protein